MNGLHLVKLEKPPRPDQDIEFWSKLIDVLQWEPFKQEEKEKIARYLANTFSVYSRS